MLIVEGAHDEQSFADVERIEVLQVLQCREFAIKAFCSVQNLFAVLFQNFFFDLTNVFKHV